MEMYFYLLLLTMVVLLIYNYLFQINSDQEQLHRVGELNYRKLSAVIILLILGTFSALRDGIGIDYEAYLIHIERIALGYPNYMEIGFQKTVKIVMHFFNDARSVIILFSFLTCFFFIFSIYDQSKNVIMSIYLFLTWGYYFLTFNTIRNYFALSLVLFSIKYLLNKKYYKFIFSIIIATLFHKSALVCLPIYFLANRKFTKKTYLLIIFGAIFLIVFKSKIQDIAFWIYPSYEGSVYDTGRVSILNVIKSLLVMVYGLIYYRRFSGNKNLLTYYNINTFALIIYIALYWLPEVSRIGFYFNIVSIIFIPNLTMLINKNDRLLVKIIIYFGSIVLFVLLMRGFYSPTIQLLPYKSWIF